MTLRSSAYFNIITQILNMVLTTFPTHIPFSGAPPGQFDTFTVIYGNILR